MECRFVGGGWSVAAPALLGAALAAGCSWDPGRNMPAAPDEVRAAVIEVDAAFDALPDEPQQFQRAAAEAIPKLRKALQGWAMEASGAGRRELIRGWSLEAGMMEASLTDLPERIETEHCGSITVAWRRLRAKIP